MRCGCGRCGREAPELYGDEALCSRCFGPDSPVTAPRDGRLTRGRWALGPLDIAEASAALLVVAVAFWLFGDARMAAWAAAAGALASVWALFRSEEP